eukprot:jgi/Mesvir1/26397/Mv16087-RA.1
MQVFLTGSNGAGHTVFLLKSPLRDVTSCRLVWANVPATAGVGLSTAVHVKVGDRSLDKVVTAVPAAPGPDITAPVPVRGRPVRRVDPQVHQPAEAGRGPIRRGHGGGSTTPVTPQVPADEQNAPPTKERNSRARAIAGAVANEANRSLITNTYAPAMVVDVAGMALDAMGLGKVADVVTKPLDFMAKHTPIGALVNAFTDPKASAECKLLKFVSLGFGSCDKTGTSCVKGSCARDDYWKALYSGDEKALEKAKKLYDPDLPAVLQLDRAAPSGERKTVAPSSTLPMRGV